MKNNKKINYIIVIVVIIILIVLAFKLFYKSSYTEPEATATPVATSTSDISENTDKLDLVSYQVYQADDLDFGFVIANLRIKSSVSEEVLDLSNYLTDENINLKETASFVSELETAGYYLGKANVYYSLVASDTNYFAQIFIPYNDLTKTTLEVSNSINDDNISFDLTTNYADISSLQYIADDVISDNQTYTMTVSKAYQATSDSFTRTFSDGTVMTDIFSSNSKLYAFEVEATSLNDEVVVIESAEYLVENDTFEALDEQYQSTKYENIVGQLITDNSKGYLFFVTYDPENQAITYNGKLSIKLKNIETPIIVDVDIK